jgi:hypothetical protein
MLSEYPMLRITGFRIENSNFSVQLFIPNTLTYILHIKNDQNSWMFDYKPGSGQTITGLNLSEPREGSYLTYNIVFHENSCLFEGSNDIRLDFFFGGSVSPFGLKCIRITEVSLDHSLAITRTNRLPSFDATLTVRNVTPPIVLRYRGNVFTDLRSR